MDAGAPAAGAPRSEGPAGRRWPPETLALLVVIALYWWPWLPAGAYGALVALAWLGVAAALADRSVLIPAALVGGGLLVFLLARAPAAAVVDGFTAAVPIFTMVMSLTLLSIPLDIGGGDRVLLDLFRALERRWGVFTAAQGTSFALSFFLWAAGPALLLNRVLLHGLQGEADLEQVAAGTLRGFALADIISPLSADGAVIQYVTGVSWWQRLSVAALLLLLGAMASEADARLRGWRGRCARAGGSGRPTAGPGAVRRQSRGAAGPASASSVGKALELAVGLTAVSLCSLWLNRFRGWESPFALTATALALSVLWSFYLRRPGPYMAEAAARLAGDGPGSGRLFLILAASAFVGAGAVDLARRSPAALTAMVTVVHALAPVRAAVTATFVTITAGLGIHPVGLLMAARPLLGGIIASNAIVASGLLLGIAVTVTASPFIGTTNLVGRLVGRSAWTVGPFLNWRFALLWLVAGVAAMARD